MAGSAFVPLPPALVLEANYKNWSKTFVTWLSQTQKYQLYYCEVLDLYSMPGEQEGAFKVRLQQKLNELRDQSKEKLRDKYAAKMNAI